MKAIHFKSKSKNKKMRTVHFKNGEITKILQEIANDLADVIMKGNRPYYVNSVSIFDTTTKKLSIANISLVINISEINFID